MNERHHHDYHEALYLLSAGRASGGKVWMETNGNICMRTDDNKSVMVIRPPKYASLIDDAISARDQLLRGSRELIMDRKLGEAPRMLALQRHLQQYVQSQREMLQHQYLDPETRRSELMREKAELLQLRKRAFADRDVSKYAELGKKLSDVVSELSRLHYPYESYLRIERPYDVRIESADKYDRRTRIIERNKKLGKKLGASP